MNIMHVPMELTFCTLLPRLLPLCFNPTPQTCTRGEVWSRRCSVSLEICNFQDHRPAGKVCFRQLGIVLISYDIMYFLGSCCRLLSEVVTQNSVDLDSDEFPDAILTNKLKGTNYMRLIL